MAIMLMTAYAGTNLTSATYIIFFIGFFLWIHLISYWTERTDRENFLLKEQITLKGLELVEQVKATEKAKEEQKNQYESKRRIVAFIFHEVRVPLNTLALGLANIEKEGVFNHLTKDQTEVLSAVKTSVEMMENVLNEVECCVSTLYIYNMKCI